MSGDYIFHALFECFIVPNVVICGGPGGPKKLREYDCYLEAYIVILSDDMVNDFDVFDY